MWIAGSASCLGILLHPFWGIIGGACGIDIIFPEAMKSEAVRTELNVPLLANMTEFGKSRLLNIKELENLGFNVVIYQVTNLRLAMGEVDRGLDAILKDGDQNAILDKMQHRKDLYDLLRYKDYSRFDQNLFNFEVNDMSAD